jgi:hypothetical protein
LLLLVVFLRVELPLLLLCMLLLKLAIVVVIWRTTYVFCFGCSPDSCLFRVYEKWCLCSGFTSLPFFFRQWWLGAFFFSPSNPNINPNLPPLKIDTSLLKTKFHNSESRQVISTTVTI